MKAKWGVVREGESSQRSKTNYPETGTRSLSHQMKYVDELFSQSKDPWFSAMSGYPALVRTLDARILGSPPVHPTHKLPGQ